MGNRLSPRCHVANAYPRVIYVKCDSERNHVNLENFKVDVANESEF